MIFSLAEFNWPTSGLLIEICVKLEDRNRLRNAVSASASVVTPNITVAENG
jgi:hypothetical protein